MNALAKRIYNIAPDSIRVTFADDSTATFEMQSAEFFQDDFQGIATPLDDDDREHRIVTVGPDPGQVVVGREREGGGFEEVGEIVAVEAVDDS